MAKITFQDKVLNSKHTYGDVNETKYSVNALYDEKVDKVTGKELSDNNYTDGEALIVSQTSGTNTGDQDLTGLVVKPTTSATLNPAAISLAKEAGTSYDAYQQIGVLALVVTGTGSVVGGNADFDVIKTADAITVLVDSTDITTIGKWPTSNDFSTTVGDIDHVLIFKKELNTNNATGVYYMITNLG